MNYWIHQGRPISKTSVGLADSVAFKNVIIKVNDPKKWSAETPYLYTVLTTLTNGKGQTIEMIPKRQDLEKLK